jgi:hypothetical protein
VECSSLVQHLSSPFPRSPASIPAHQPTTARPNGIYINQIPNPRCFIVSSLIDSPPRCSRICSSASRNQVVRPQPGSLPHRTTPHVAHQPAASPSAFCVAPSPTSGASPPLLALHGCAVDSYGTAPSPSLCCTIASHSLRCVVVCHPPVPALRRCQPRDDRTSPCRPCVAPAVEVGTFVHCAISRGWGPRLGWIPQGGRDGRKSPPPHKCWRRREGDVSLRGRGWEAYHRR